MVTNESIRRVVIWFSAGVTSAVAAKIAADKWRDSGIPVELVTCDTGSEHEDNARFANDVAAWVGLPLVTIRNEKYANTFEVYDETGYIKNRHGAKCTTELKKRPREQYQRAGDLQVFGFDAGEKHRAKRFIKHNPEVNPWFPLVEMGISKNDCRKMLIDAGIDEPITYAMGFKNANCLAAGCVKGGAGYWNHVRRVFPDVFQRMAEKERELGYALLQLVIDGELRPVFLDELNPNAGDYNTEPAFQCGLFCGKV